MTVACEMVNDDRSVDRLLKTISQLIEERQGDLNELFIPCKKYGKAMNDTQKEPNEENKTDGSEYVLGPDKEPYPGWCHEVVINTARSLHMMIALVPRTEVRIVLSQLIECLKEEGLRCCDLGGVWKGCVGPLAKKLYIWNQKWKMFEIPPDPAWD
jgi:hypothetical protein